MENFDLDLTEVEKAEQQSTEVVSTEETEESTAHKVLFYIVMGILGLSGVGIPVLIWLLVKKSKRLKQVEKELSEAKANQVTEKKEETKEETKQETKEPETKEETK